MRLLNGSPRYRARVHDAIMAGLEIYVHDDQKDIMVDYVGTILADDKASTTVAPSKY